MVLILAVPVHEVRKGRSRVEIGEAYGLLNNRVLEGIVLLMNATRFVPIAAFLSSKYRLLWSTVSIMCHGAHGAAARVHDRSSSTSNRSRR